MAPLTMQCLHPQMFCQLVSWSRLYFHTVRDEGSRYFCESRTLWNCARRHPFWSSIKTVSMLGRYNPAVPPAWTNSARPRLWALTWSRTPHISARNDVSPRLVLQTSPKNSYHCGIAFQICPTAVMQKNSWGVGVDDAKFHNSDFFRNTLPRHRFLIWGVPIRSSYFQPILSWYLYEWRSCQQHLDF